MGDQLKYGRVERERRWLLASVPDVAFDRAYDVVDRYVIGTRLRLRRMARVGGDVAYKLARKLPPVSPGAGVMGNLYLSDGEHALLQALPARVVHKRLHYVGAFRVDVFSGALDGLVTAEVEEDDADVLATLVPPFPVVRDVTADPTFGGASLAARVAPPLEVWRHGPLGDVDALWNALDALPEAVEEAASWMVALHRHQPPRPDGAPYVTHPAEVARRVAAWGGDEAQIIAALLHDAVEDQDERLGGPRAIEARYGAEVRSLVEALTTPKGADYAAHVRALSPRALAVKAADLSTNALRLDAVTDAARRDKLACKYGPVVRYVAEALPADHPARPLFTSAAATWP